MNNVLQQFLDFKDSSEVSSHIGHIENNVSLQDLRRDAGVDVGRSVLNVRMDVFPWLAHHEHWLSRTLPIGPANGRDFVGYLLMPTRSRSVYCLVTYEIEPGLGNRTHVYFVRATRKWFSELEQKFLRNKESLYFEAPNGFSQDAVLAKRCEGMMPYYAH